MSRSSAAMNSTAIGSLQVESSSLFSVCSRSCVATFSCIRSPSARKNQACSMYSSRGNSAAMAGSLPSHRPLPHRAAPRGSRRRPKPGGGQTSYNLTAAPQAATIAGGQGGRNGRLPPLPRPSTMNCSKRRLLKAGAKAGGESTDVASGSNAYPRSAPKWRRSLVTYHPRSFSRWGKGAPRRYGLKPCCGNQRHVRLPCFLVMVAAGGDFLMAPNKRTARLCSCSRPQFSQVRFRLRRPATAGER